MVCTLALVKRAVPEGKVLDLQVDIHSNPHLWSVVL